MSGREHEPVAAFFPPIDRNLMRDLDRQLRSAAPNQPETPPTITPFQPAPVPVPPEPVPSRSRPSIANVVEAVEQAAQSIVEMTSRIEALEQHIDILEASNRHLEMQIAEADQALRHADTKLRSEAERVVRLESVATHQTSRAIDLERELASAHADLARITEAIAATLGLPDETKKGG